MSEWIAIKDRMPPDAEGVLVTDGKGYFAVAQQLGGDWLDVGTNDDLLWWTTGGMERWDPTHWMRLPHFPNVKRSDDTND